MTKKPSPPNAKFAVLTLQFQNYERFNTVEVEGIHGSAVDAYDDAHRISAHRDDAFICLCFPARNEPEPMDNEEDAGGPRRKKAKKKTKMQVKRSRHRRLFKVGV